MEQGQSSRRAIATVSTVDALATELRRDVLDGRLAAGARLNEVALARDFGVGRHTLRAALARLVHAGLLRAERNRGVFVRVASLDDLRDLGRLRRALELGALDLALAAGADFAAARSAVDRLAALPPSAAWTAITDAHDAVHGAIVAAAASPRFAAAYGALEGERALFVRQLRPAYPLARMVELHEALVAELCSGDPGRARAALALDLDGGAAALEAAFAARAG
jgi:DNA-binding GntR family transcriptional regulator